MAATKLHFENRIDNRYLFIVEEPFNCTICIYGVLGDTLYVETNERYSSIDSVRLLVGLFDENSNINEELKKIFPRFNGFNEVKFLYKKHVISVTSETTDYDSVKAIEEKCPKNDPYYFFKRYKSWVHDINSIELNNNVLRLHPINY